MKKVLLTGISGYIGLHCAVELIKQGYAVRGSVRNLSKSKEVTDALSKQVELGDNLEFCELNLLSDEGWEKATAGCDFLMHTASPFVSKIPKDENELIKPAVEGTQRALAAANKAGIKRVVLTSSIVAMLGDFKDNTRINQDSWTNTNAKLASAYIKSKTLAEKAAWAYSKEHKLELVTVHPGPVYGPTLSDNLSGESMSLFERLLTGKMKQVIHFNASMSDVRDIAKIHTAALENPNAKGQRFIVTSEKAIAFQQITKLLKNKGYKKVGTGIAPNFLVKLLANFNSEMKGMLPYLGRTYQADVENTMKTFNWTPIPFETTVIDTALSVTEVLQRKA